MVNYCLGLRDWRQGDYSSGLELLKLAAGWGSKGAQYTLGLIYYNGHHVEADRALGIAWLKLANERHDDAQIALALRSAIKWATAAQRQRAGQLFATMRKRYGDKVAAARAWRQFKHWRQHVTHARFGLFPSGCVVPGGPQGISGPMSRARRLAGVPTPNIYKGACLSFKEADKKVRRMASGYFHGWRGVVKVGPLHQVPATAASSGH